MINSFANYLKTGKIKKKTPDPVEAKALLNQAKDRLNYVKEKKILDKNSKFILEDSYEVARESVQSYMSLKGFKPYSHEATISFIKKFLNNTFSEEEIFKLDYFRILRNNSIYRAAPVTKQDAKDSIHLQNFFYQNLNN